MTTLDDLLAEIERRAEAASPAPWRWIGDEMYGGIGVGSDGRDTEWVGSEDEEWNDQPVNSTKIIETDSGVYPPRERDRAFLAAARTDVPRLVAALREACRVIDRDARFLMLDSDGVLGDIRRILAGEENPPPTPAATR